MRITATIKSLTNYPWLVNNGENKEIKEFLMAFGMTIAGIVEMCVFLYIFA